MIFITGDTHRELDIHTINPREFVEGRTLTRDDYVIICGDFGCIWDGGSGDRFWLNWLESEGWNTLFIDGNHENFDVLNQYPEETWHGGKVHRIRSNIFHLMRGEVFDIEGKRFFTFGGASSHDAQYRTEHQTWWKDELPTTSEIEHAYQTLEKHDWKVDYVLTHDIYRSHPLGNKYTCDMSLYGDGYHSVPDFLESIKNKLDYSYWFNGHYHTDEVHFTNQKPCITLFDRIINIEKVDDFINEKTGYKLDN